jgi:hypothetical protein
MARLLAGPYLVCPQVWVPNCLRVAQRSSGKRLSKGRDTRAARAQTLHRLTTFGRPAARRLKRNIGVIPG